MSAIGSAPSTILRVALVETPVLHAAAELKAAGVEAAVIPAGPDALARVKELGANVLVLDHDLPDGGGPSLLEAAVATLPDVRVVLLSGATTARAVVRMYRQGADDVVLKPITPAELALVLTRFGQIQAPQSPPPKEETPQPAAQQKPAHGLLRPSWAVIAADGGPLPPLHPQLADLQSATSRLDSSVGDVIRIAESDPALASRVLQTANTAWYRGPRAYTNIRDACVRIGNRETLGIFMEAAYSESFRGSHPALRSIVDKFRRATVLAARVSRVLAAEANINKVEELYAATLLHNNGELILLWRLGSTLAPQEQLNGDRIDEAAYFIDQLHEECGASFARSRTLPPMTAVLAQHHHNPRPGEAPYDQTLRRIVLAAWAKARQAVGPYLPTRHPADVEALYKELNVGPGAQNKIDTLVRTAIAEGI